MKLQLKISSFFVLTFFPPLICLALSPMVQFQDLVAGDGHAGFFDGPFYASQFNDPEGLALDETGGVLYIADSGNHRIRSINLQQQNEVKTIAGTGTAGFLDGVGAAAKFNNPTCLAVLPGNLLAVADAGNQRIRLVDLTKGVVSTLAGGGALSEGEALKVAVGNIWNMAYLPVNDCLYFSEPENGSLRKLSVKTGQVEVVLKNNAALPNPKALAVVDGKLYVGDQNLGAVYFVKEKKQAVSSVAGAAKNANKVFIQEAGKARNVIALAGFDKSLYAYQADSQYPVFRVFPNAEALTFFSLGGQKLSHPGVSEILDHFRGAETGTRVGFAADILSPNRFYVTNPKNSIICSFRDLRFAHFDPAHGEDEWNSGRLHDFEYPLVKPQQTFRILLAGRCYLYWEISDEKYENPKLDTEEENYFAGVAKKMEVALNTRASLEDWPCHFEVLNGAMHNGSNVLEFWPYYALPSIVEKYDVDLVLILHDDGFNFFDAYFACPISPEGIPQSTVDPEFVLKPNSEKFKSGPMKEFLDLLQSKKLITNLKDVSAFTLCQQGSISGMARDPDVKKKVINMMGEPLEMFKRKIESHTTNFGEKSRLEVWLFPTSIFVNPVLRSFLKEAYESAGIPYVDLCDDFAVLGMSYAPCYLTPFYSAHFTEDGMFLFSAIMVHELVKNKKIPMGRSQN